MATNAPPPPHAPRFAERLWSEEVGLADPNPPEPFFAYEFSGGRRFMGGYATPPLAEPEPEPEPPAVQP